MDKLVISRIPAETDAITPKSEGQEVLGWQTKVEPDGSAMTLTLHTSEGSTRFLVPFGQASGLEAEVHQAALLMLYRQTAAPNPTHNPIDELIRAALRPSRVSVGIDRSNGDRLFLQEFGGERLPRIVRMSPDAVNDTCAELSAAAASHAN
ncbi:hypothetical protein [Mesorhizobium sp.]|uniref:hypothetical protein n=1 Tax=Mesorhizobium sp. TaxID=1871066 RepID=UPI000FE4DC3C|nr:hypothetical protein [Mesorhizobium sp.]RWP31781.1 MAG: hypothetical protein EOR02_08165 [Mesorhizobium sp.]TIM07575.1 MAG: hypothetical protein E5Y62_18595 [Mesorhizobium sp.]